MNPDAYEIRDTIIVILTLGDVIPAQKAKAVPNGIELTSGSLKTIVDPLAIESIHILKLGDTFSKIANEGKSPEVNTAIARTLCGVIEIEQLAASYNKEKGTGAAKNLNLIIFGSASLAMTILPSRVSHDVDTVGPSDFIRYCEEKTRRSHGAIPEFSSVRLLNYLGAWQERASSLEGIYGTKFTVLHPLDTVMQKLLRADKERFEKNDQPDIKRIVEILHPDQQTLTELLTENPARYRIPPEKIQGKAVRNNTSWFLSQFLPHINLETLITEAEKREEEVLEKYGFIPLKPIRSPETAPQKNLSLKELLHRNDPPSEPVSVQP